ncbi:Translation initiation factor 3 subunit c [Actinomortierella ambigua]|uniref:Eukaryotic translation initiation factor 3 subunit C n=1 Tax=Actinomortierella ambigua TaxID=1343610 RepID=A0A9P6Q7Y4_9FUNG|nr:Translation initiation factor 3 subunit c [Actinomortierella ambigua]
MSRFFEAGFSDTDDSESDFSDELTDSELSDSDQSDSDSDSDDDSKPKNRFAFGASDDSDESEDEVRVVRSAKDKRFDEIEQAVTTMTNGQKIGDWVSVQNEFDKANKALQKAGGIIAQNGVPKFYIKAVAELEKAIQSAQEKEKSASKKMNASNSKALNSMKQKVKKNNRLYETEIAEYEKNPETYGAEEEEEETAVKTKKPKKAKKALSESEDEGQEGEDQDDDGFTTVGAKGKGIEFNQENLFKRLREVNDARGKKNTDREEQARILEKLLTVASTPYQKIRVLLALVSAQFDFAIGLSGFMSIPLWKTAHKHLNSLLVILENNPNFVVQESVPEDEEDMDMDKDRTPSTPEETVFVQGSVVAFVDRLDDEFIKSLQNIDPHTPDYVDRLKDEIDMYTIIVRSLAYFKRRQLTDSICRTTMRRIEHLYFKPETVILACEKATAEKLPATVATAATDSSALIHDLCVYLYKNGASLLRTRAMLSHVYHHALHNRFYVARDMLLMSHLQETIFQADITTQIAHNRTMVQLGLCAFRQGMIKEAHACLQDISGTGRVKELLAQGLQMQRYGSATPEQEKLERQRQLPFHMHINLELLECVYLTCSMLLEIPAMAQAGSSLDARKKVISKPFRRMLDYNSRQVFTGPPENTRDHIMGAAKAMASGEWQKSCELINAIKIWDLMPETDKIKEMLGRKIQEEALRTYLFSNAPYYSSIGLEQLAKMFELTVANVNAIVSKMIWNEELSASIDQVSNVVVLHRVEHSKLQALALAFAEKASGFVDSNEKLLESKTPQQNERPKKGGPNAGKDQASGKQQQQRTMGHQPRGGRGRNQFNNGLGNSVRGSRK